MGQEHQRPGVNTNNQVEKTARGVVARGRTIMVPDTNDRRVVNHTPEGKAVYRCAERAFGPGQEVELPATEIVSLRERGFLIDPGQPIPPLADGPHYTETGSHATAA
jgi:hypothetical protein